MAADTVYTAHPYVYQSVGLVARPILDRAPEHSYLDMRNCFEREEGSMSSRFGTEIINRDPNGTIGGQNYYFTSPANTLAKLAYGAFAYRYAGLENGSLYRRTGNSQGSYSSIYTGLSGEPFGWLVDSCYETSRPYIFIYDSNASIKDDGTLGAPQLTGIDPPAYTANAVPYSPLLTLIDNFATGNSYTTSGFAGSWAYGSVAAIAGINGAMVTDFPQFSAGTSNYEINGGNVFTSQTGVGVTANQTIFSGFPSVVLNPATVVTVSIGPASTGYTIVVPSGTGNACGLSLQYSIDGGSTWTIFWSLSFGASITISNLIFNVPVTGLTNLDLLQIKIFASAQIITGSGTASASFIAGDVANGISASFASSGVFGEICNGILSVLNTNTLSSVPIVSVTASGLSGGIYTTLTVITARVHGLSSGQYVSMYASSNDLIDGFYEATVVNTTKFTVPYNTTLPLSATGGMMYTYAAGTPSTCVLTDEYSTPYPAQFSAWGFYQTVPISTTSFPIGAWSGLVDTDSTATVGVTANYNLSMNNQVTDYDLIVLTLMVTNPANILSIQLAFDVNGSDYTSSYYYANISPAYYQGNIAGIQEAYASTQSQILADTLGVISGQPIGSTTAQLQPSNLSTGSGTWQAVLIPRGNFLPVGSAGQSGLDWTNITGWKITITTTAVAITGNGSSTVACNGLYLQWGYGPSSFAGVGYDYRFTYYNANTGTESNGSPEMQFNEQYGYLSSLAAPFYLRQAAQVTGRYSSDPQVTHLRIYRRGGTFASNWYQIDQVPNLTAAGPFAYKDVIPDSSLQGAQTLALDNDPPVTSNLVTPIQTSLSAATTVPVNNNNYYSTYAPQLVTVAQSGAVFVPEQVVLIGNANNLEECLIVAGGTGQFATTLRLQHNAGEPVICYSIPRAFCNICCLANDGTVYLAGDKHNPQRIYRSKVNNPEAFSPAAYTDVSSPDDTVMAIINWRGTLVAGTMKTWELLPGGASKPVPTGAAHGLVGTQAWTLAEGMIPFRSQDGLRVFTGADGDYLTLPIEWMYQGNPLCIPPQAYQPDASQDVLCFFNNTIYDAYVSNSSGAAGPIYRTAYSTVYKRFRYDDIPATAMLWEKDTNAFLVAKEMSPGNYAIVQDWVGDYDDGGWVAGSLVQTPINVVIQSPYLDLGSPHNDKQWNALETDVNTQGQSMTTALLFDDGTIPSITLPAITTSQRTKVQSPVTPSGANEGSGQQAYRASIQHTIQVTTAPILYQESIYAATLAAYRFTFDTYWILGGTDLHKRTKQVVFDYTAGQAISFSIFADGSTIPYHTFTLPEAASRAVVRVRFPALSMRTFRMIGNIASGQAGFQAWAAPQLWWKPCLDSSGYQQMDLVV
jgi:hypothetical protein